MMLFVCGLIALSSLGWILAPFFENFHRNKKFLWLLLGLFPYKNEASGQRHIVLLRADQEKIYGSYFLAPQASQEPLILNLPQECQTDLQQEGLLSSQVQKQPDGSLLIKTDQTQGLLSIEFECERKLLTSDTLHFENRSPYLKELSLATQRELTLESKELTPGLPPMLAQTSFQGLTTKEPPKVGERFDVRVLGFPPSRLPYHLLALFYGCVLGLLFLLEFLRNRSEARPEGKIF